MMGKMAEAPKDRAITTASFSGLPPKSGLMPSFFSSSVLSQSVRFSAIRLARLTACS